MRKILIISFAFLILSFGFCYAASITKDSQTDFAVSGSLFENTTAAVEPGSVVLEIEGTERIWFTDGVTVAAAADYREYPQIISDGSGGGIITWEDYRNLSDYDIYVQRMDATGNVSAGWPENGVVICAAAESQYDPQLISDGFSGAIIVWEDERGGNFDIYAQRVDGSGSVRWTPNGVAICTAANIQSDPQLIPDGLGGAIIVWEDERGGNFDIYAQRVDGDGNVRWTSNGVAICTAANIQSDPQLIPDGLGGAIIVWEDERSGDFDIYAQRVDGDGNVRWTSNGIVVCNAANSQGIPQLASDGSGGAIITWRDYRSGSYYDIYAQKINISGDAEWAAVNGEVICDEDSIQNFPQLISDGLGGAIIAWEDWRSGFSNKDIYAQRINSSGVVEWTSNGVVICNATNNQVKLKLCSNDTGGAIMVWEDGRSGVDIIHIYAQEIGSGGNVRWGENGKVVCDAAGYRYSPQLIPDGFGGAIFVWEDGRRTDGSDIYAQRISNVYFSSGNYTSEKIENTDPLFSGWTTLGWVGSGTLTADVKTATSSSGLDSVSWIPVSNEGDIPNRGDIFYKWIQVRMIFSPADLRTISARLDLLNINYQTDTSPPIKTADVISGPNPFSPETESTFLTYQLSQDIEVTIYIFSSAGELVYKQVILPPNEGAHAGYNRVEWEGRNQNGAVVANGVYFFKVFADGKVIGSGKIIALR